MFGHQDDKKDEPAQNATVEPETTEEAVDTAPAEHDQPQDTVMPDAGAADSQQDDTPKDGDKGSDEGDGDQAAAPADDDIAPEDKDTWQHPGAPLHEDSQDKDEEADNGPEKIKDIIAPAGGGNPPSFRPPTPGFSDNDNEDNTPHELIDIKQKALSDLAPLLGQLDQSPEDKFRTLMMMIQASDDQSLIKSAFEAAENIKDDKLKAQALLDIVNEINYFTQHPEA